MNEWKKNVRSVIPYIPGEQPKNKNVIKLNTNENPYPPSPAVAAVLADTDPGILRKYPDPAISELTGAIAEVQELKESEIFVGIGSDDVLALSFLTFFNSPEPILFPDITYSFYDVWAELYRIPYRCQPLDERFRVRKEDYFIRNGGIVLANPNAPTGVEMPRSDIERILEKNPGSVVIVDEAYVDFGAASVLPLIRKYDNLLVVQTFSKSRSLAGMRIGFACGNPELIRALQDVKYSFNSYTLNTLSIRVGTAAIRDREWFEKTRSQIINTREWAKGELRALGFEFEDSRTNFVFASHPLVPAETIFRLLRERDIYVRHFTGPRIENYLRITIGTREEMAQLFSALAEILMVEKAKGGI